VIEDALTAIFSHVCGQGRAFGLGGQALPVCERCLGLYTGAALTAAWLVATGLRRRGLPHLEGAMVQSAALLAAMAGGLHWADAGPAWRLACGLWTGHVAILWLVGGANHLLGLAGRASPLDLWPQAFARRVSAPAAPWPWGKRLQTVLAPAVLAAGACAFAHWAPAGGPGPATWYATSALVALGAAALVAALARAAVLSGAYLLGVLRRRTRAAAAGAGP